ncbi:MAG: GTPase ObgE [Spirochaetaceae bacterium]|nr:MAG: GTPase ObgE [Spirochaetaceae bacterium]
MQRFVDDVTFTIRSGHGGAGSVSFRRERYVPRGGPDGGNGGRGGDVVVRVRRNLKTLAHLTGHTAFSAENGRPGEGRKRHGRDGSAWYLEVPPGAAIHDAETGELLADITEEVDDFVLISGGRGGKGNTHFKSSTHRTPRFAQPGEPGEERRITVELRLIADIGFVGLPNAGKSSLLRVLTAAHPKVGNYPFTTKIPNLGVMRYHDHDVILADIPGIIEGAAEGAGLGHRFLRHISRTAVLALLIDVTEEHPDAVFATLLHELSAFDSELAQKRRIVVGTKCDLDPDGEYLQRLAAACGGEQVIGVSAAARSGLDAVIAQFGRMVVDLPSGEADG